MKNDCLFCKIAEKKAESLILYEDDIVIVILDAFPDSDGHTLVIPKKHIGTIYDMDEETFAHINKIAKKYAKILMEKLDKTSMSFMINYGDAQVIKHFHLHLLPNWKDKATLTKEEVYSILKEK